MAKGDVFRLIQRILGGFQGVGQFLALTPGKKEAVKIGPYIYIYIYRDMYIYLGCVFIGGYTLRKTKGNPTFVFVFWGGALKRYIYMGVDQYSWPPNDHGNCSHIVENITFSVVSPIVVPCKGTIDPYACMYIYIYKHRSCSPQSRVEVFIPLGFRGFQPAYKGYIPLLGRGV